MSSDNQAYKQGYSDAVEGKRMDEFFKQFDGYVQGYTSGQKRAGNPAQDQSLYDELKALGLDDYQIDGCIQGMEDAKAGKKRRRNYKAIYGYAEGYNAEKEAQKKHNETIDELCKLIENMSPHLEDEDEALEEYDAFKADFEREERKQRKNTFEKMLPKLALFFLINCLLTICLLLFFSKKTLWNDSSNKLPFTPPGEEDNPIENANLLFCKLTNTKWGVVNSNGNEVLPARYELLQNVGGSNPPSTMLGGENQQFALGTLGAFVKMGNKWGYITSSAKETIHPAYDSMKNATDQMLLFKENNLWGLITTQGDIVVPAQYTTCYGFIEGYAQVEKNKKLGFINSHGTEVVKPIYEQLGFFNANGVTWMVKENTIGVVNTDGKEKLLPDINNIEETDFGFLLRQGSYYGMLDRWGNAKLLVAFTSITEEDGKLLLKNYTKNGIADRDGNIILPCVFDQITTHGNRYRVNRNGSFGIYDQQGTEIIPCTYDLLGPSDDGQYYLAIKNGLYGYFEQDGSTLVPCAFQEAYIEGGGYAKVKQYGLYGWFDTNTGDFAIPPQYEFVWGEFKSKNDVVKARRPNGEVVKIDYYGKEVTGKSLKDYYKQLIKD